MATAAGTLDRQQLEQLVWLDLPLRGDDRATHESVYQAQQERLRQLPDEAAIEQWFIDLHHEARLFRKILDPQHEIDPRLGQALDRLDRWGVAVVLHVLLAHHAGQLTAGEAAASLRIVESYLVRRILAGLSSSNNNRLSSPASTERLLALALACMWCSRREHR